MSLIAYGNTSDSSATAMIENNGFWPDIAVQGFREAERIDSSMTTPRVEHALRVAMADVNRQLADWQIAHVAEGRLTHTDVTLEPWQTPDTYALLYRRAIYATAHASLLERYRDYSATDTGDERGEAKDEAADDYRRDARWAVAEITGRTHTTVELI